MWRCSCRKAYPNPHSDSEQFCIICGDAKPWIPTIEMISRFREIKCLVAAGRYSEEIEGVADS